MKFRVPILFHFRGGSDRSVRANHPASRQRRGNLAGALLSPEQLEHRLVMAGLVGRDTNDPEMVPPTKVGDPPNPQWNMQKIQADIAWTIYTGQPRNIVAVMDYGLDYDHEDFGSSLNGTKGNLWDRAQFGTDTKILASKRGRDEINNVPGNTPDGEAATKPKAGDFLGNHAGGIIAALTNNSLGVAGINWNTQLYSSKVLDGGKAFSLGVLERAVDHIKYLRAGAPNEQFIRSVAFGYSSATDYGNPFPIWARLGSSSAEGIADPTKGFLVSVPAGDLGPGTAAWAPLPKYYVRGNWDPSPNPPNTPAYATTNNPAGVDAYSPGSTDNVIVVGATDENDQRWSGNSNLPRIDIYAPGVSIISLGDGTKSYQTITGTREAAAHVAGAISLIYDAAVQQGKTLTYLDVRRAIIEGGDDIGLDRPRLNIVGALRYLGLDTKPNPSATTVAITGGQAVEGNSGQAAATFTLSIGKALTAPVTVQCRVSDGSATVVDSDYASLSVDGLVNVVIPAGQTTATFSVRVNGDNKVESSETIVATIVKVPSPLTIGSVAATWTILNDDLLPTISFDADVSVREGTGRGGTARLVARLSRPMSEIVSVYVTLMPGTATAGQDYLSPAAARMVVFRPNTSAQWIDVPIFGDTAIEPNETFSVVLQNPSKATLGVKQNATVTIIDDDAPVVSLSPAVARALASGATTLTFTVSLSAAAKSPVSLAYAAVNGTAVNGPIGVGDFILPSGTLEFAVGERTKRITATINPRKSGVAYPKKFTLTLSNAVNTTFSGGLSSQSVEALIT